MRKDKIEVKDDGKIELLRKDREQYEILVVTHHVQGEGASASSFFSHEKSRHLAAFFEGGIESRAGKALN